MLTMEADFRWQDVWRFLSLDDNVVFLEDLWVPFEPKLLSNGLRSVLQQWGNDHEFYLSNPSVVSNVCFRWFERTFGVPELQVLILWAANVYIGRDGKRMAEFVWDTVGAESRRNSAVRDHAAPWMIDFFEKIQRSKMKIWPKLEEKLALRASEPISDWDRTAQMMRGTDREADATTTELIIHRNVFAFCWEMEVANLTPGELNELYRFGQQLQSERKVGFQGNIGFPGGWRFFLLPFLQNVPATWKLMAQT